MKSSIPKQSKTISALIHISILSKYFIPLGNYIIPLLLWQANTKDSFISKNGKEALNFQLSLLVYSILLVIIAIPFVIYTLANTAMSFDHQHHITDEYFLTHINEFMGITIFGIIAGLCILTTLVVEIVCAILAATRASDGEVYKYPITIRFIK
ncbi:DUF4870 domain-containing protein [Aquimarina rhabdastrellae]